MREWYFQFSNGDIVEPFSSLPSHRVITDKGKIVRIDCCFSVTNIVNNGFDWFQSSVDKENEFWGDRYFNHLGRLHKFVHKQYLKYPLKPTNFKQENNKFPFILVWKGDDTNR